MIKLLATDLDGTLVRSDNSVSDATRDAIAAAARAGLHIVFVTGRPTRWLWEVSEAAGYTGIVVAANGAITYDLARQTLLNQHVMSPDVVRETTRNLAHEFGGVHFAVDSGDTFAYEPGYAHDWDITPARRPDGRLHPPAVIADLADIIARPCVKLLARVQDADPDSFLSAATQLLGDGVSVTHSAQSALLEISAAGVTKASGLADYSQQLGIAQHEVAAVGDMPNDIPMLRWAGSAFAVANAHPWAQEAADEVLAESNDEDAVAVLIHRLIGL
jgi:Cof subfamily protein (haloacid dehalogenase superfamily)